ncbi:uncharacterized protein LOC112003156 [Quercus suber]|uniref:uncharacterized protein LOC112003156 n=1 Tax=Quercus suber TaxID=58331 RepID=UPI000CE1FC4F|nr:uncharacterized protein LOC112003156 [Quercus suber]
MGGDPSRRNQNLYCTYHKDKGHTTEQCRVLRDHLGQLVNAGDRGTRQGALNRGNSLPPPLGIIEVIHAAPKGLTATKGKEVMAVESVHGSSDMQPFGKNIKLARETIAFDDNDLEGTVQPHDDALVVTARISDFLVKRVMKYQGSRTDVMYSDLFRGLVLKNEDLSRYSTPLVKFNGKVVVPEGKISLLMNMEGKEVVVTFIVIASFSPYMVILGRPWIHAMEAVLFTLHVKVKFPTKQGIAMVRGSQWTARQCLVALVDWKEERTDQKEKAEQMDPSPRIPL